ncbi:MAG: peptide ABC transporter substrate-binding protein [Myxococcales bacterium]|nr:peptide ABC transporter substrate-binding protein [Myxococcales bacterium]
MRKRRLIALSLVLLTASCRGEQELLPPDTFGMGIGSDPQTFDPGVMSGSVEGRIAYQLFEGLYSPAPGEQEPVPGVAESHEVSEDGLTWTFHLRSDARWHNGDPVTAEDFRYAWLRILRGDIAADYIGFMRYLKNGRAFEEGRVGEDQVGVHVIDRHTLQVELENPIPYFLQIVSFYTYFPVHRGSIEEHGQEGAFRAENVIGNGPYQMVEYRLRNQIVLEKAPTYWNAANVQIERIQMEVIEDLAAHVTAYMDGRIDWTYDLPDNQLGSLRASDAFRSDNWLGTYYYRFNTTRGPTTDIRVRRALSLAVNREELCRCTLDELYEPARSFVPPMPNYPELDMVHYDPVRARELLAEAGYPNGEGFPRLELLYNTSENHRVIAEAVQDMWQRELNIEVTLSNQEWQVYLESTDNLDYEVARAGWIGDYRDPNTFLELWTGDDQNNDTGWDNPEYNRLIQASRQEPNPERRLGYLLEAERLLLDEVPIMPIYFYAQFHLVRPNVCGWEMNLSNTHLVSQLWKVEPGQSCEGGN